MSSDMLGKVAVVTGSSQGIGKAISLELAAAGVLLVLNSRSEDNLNALSDEIVNSGGNKPVLIAGDLADPTLSKKIIQQVDNEYQRVDILINNGEGPPPGTFLNQSDAAWKLAYESNLLAPIKFSQEVAPYMIKQGWGRVVNITSLQAKEPAPSMVLSATMRAGLSAFAKAISIELAPFGITVNTVCPSAVLTQRMVKLTTLSAEAEGISYDEILARAQGSIPMKRFSTPEEIAHLVTFLCSDKAAYMTGLSINIDGGLAKGTF